VICPLCQNAQQRGSECDVCGRRLEGAGHAPEAILPVDGLEPTLHDPAPPTPVAHLAGLEPTSLSAGAAAPVEPLAELELLPDAASIDGAVEALPVDRLERLTPEPFAPGPRACPSCAAPAGPDAVYCTGCGLRLPSLHRWRMAEPAPEPTGRCPACGERAEAAVCRHCGARIAAARG
jgi:predicted amidophosphoribosyltransferase